LGSTAGGSGRPYCFMRPRTAIALSFNPVAETAVGPD
jgi:hypothetical protein